jgi:hypothetical protein
MMVLLPEHMQQFIRRHRLVIIIALMLVTSMFFQIFNMIEILNTLRDDIEIKAFYQVDDSPDNLAIMFLVQTADECLIDLDYIHGKFRKIAEGRKACTKIIDHEGKPGKTVLEVINPQRGFHRIADKNPFGHLKLESPGINLVLLKSLRNLALEKGVIELARAYINAQVQIGAAMALKMTQHAAGLEQNHRPKGYDNACFFRQGNKITGQNKPLPRMHPANKGFEANDAGSVSIDGLKIEGKLGSTYSRPEPLLEVEPAGHFPVHLGGKKTVGVSPFLGPVHCNIGIGNKQGDIAAVIGNDRDAYAHSQAYVGQIGILPY